jgi:hypothetical protein
MNDFSTAEALIKQFKGGDYLHGLDVLGNSGVHHGTYPASCQNWQPRFNQESGLNPMNSGDGNVVS